MLLDTQKLEPERDYVPSEYERDKKVFVFCMTWEGEDEGDLLSFADALNFVATFNGDASALDFDEARELLDSGHPFRVGPDEDWYRFTALETPMKHNYAGELIREDEPFSPERETPFDCSPGVDYPASM
jgi:hypothetical protein